MNYSRQREIIQEAVQKNPIHPTADDVYWMLKADNPSLSLSTVYRNLNLLADNGMITKISLPNQSDRFDGDMTDHYHMICEKCGNVHDINLDFLNDLDQKIFEQTGFAAVSHQLVIRGICQKCKKG